MRIHFAIDAIASKNGTIRYRFWDSAKTPHVLIMGSTGSGKTFLVRLILAKIGLHVRNARVTLCDFKADDFHDLKGLPNHYEFTDCLIGLDTFYDAFLARQCGQDANRDFRLLIFDEWAACLNTLDKKEADAARTKLSTLLMLGRSFGCHVLISQQRADAEYFAKARDNFGLVIAMGNISKESAAMFGFDREVMEPVEGVGFGHMLSNGQDLTAIKVPAVRDMAKFERFLRVAVG